MKRCTFSIDACISLIALAFVLISSGCASAGGGKPQLTVLLLKDNPGQDVPTQQQLQQWAKTNNVNLHIQISTLQNLPVKTSTIIQSESGPDVFILQGYGPQLYSNALLDLSDVAQKVDKEDGSFYDISKQVGMVNGQWKAIPIYIYMHQLIYRKDILKAIGEPVPATWDDFLRVSNKIEAKYGKNGMDAFGVSYGRSSDGAEFVQGVLWAYGSRMFSPDGKTVTFDSPQTVAGLQYVVNLYQNHLTPAGVLSWDDSGNNKAFLSNQIAMTVNGSSIKSQAQTINSTLAANTGIAVYPKGPDGQASVPNAFSIAVRKNTQNPALAKSMIEYLFQPSNYSQVITRTGGAIGTSLQGFNNLPIWQNPDNRAMLDAIPTAHLTGWPAPPSRVSAEIDSQAILTNMVGRVINDHLTPEQAVKEASDQIQALIQ